MSITSSFYSALSGLDTQGTAMQVIGDNIANTKTTGFKSSTAHFEDVLGVSLSGVTGSNQTGAGSKISSVDGNFIQGSLETTDVATDIADNGKGFFIVQDPSSSELFYTRAGHFMIDSQGYYVNSEGYQIQGYLYDSTGTNLIESLADIQINQNSMIPPRVTSQINMVLNLDGGETIVPAATAFDATDPNTYNYSTTLNIYDSLGQVHSIHVYFTKRPDTAGPPISLNWEWNAMIDGSDVQLGTPGVLQAYGTGTVNFDTSGQLTTAMPVNFYTGAITFANGLTPPATTLDFTNTTQYGSDSAIQSLSQNGYAAGTVSGVGIDEKGNIVASYTNGTRQKIARLALADFPNLNGLARKGMTLYQATSTSGDPLYNKPGVGGMGTISSSMLEESNVDLASEFIKMIIVQRGYQANTKVITTTDDMLAQLINIR
jgi:flagellar hook protein FlgE